MADSGSLGKTMGSAGLAEELHPCRRGLCKEEEDSPPGPQAGRRQRCLPHSLLYAEAAPAS